MRINQQRLMQSLFDLANIGATAGGGVSRLALSDEDKAGRDLLRRWMEEAGLDVRIDDFGTMTGRRAGSEDGPAVMLASHCDSVRNGGKYDGAYGVMGGLEVIRTLNDHGIATQKPIELVNWTNEEGVRFEPALLASGAALGHFTKEYAYDRRDWDGLRFEDELRRIGYMGEEANRPGPCAAYLELHIEQGPVLEAEGLPVGVVEGIVGLTWQEITVIGHADHAGPSPMPLRHDALAAAAAVILSVEEIAKAQQGAVGTCGRIAIKPNIINTIPGEAVFSADFRHSDPAILETMVERLAKRVELIAAERKVSMDINRFWTIEPTPFDATVLGAVQASADELGIPTMRLWSGAAHDAKYAQTAWPSAMIFCRSINGLSHCEDEHSEPEDLAAGTDVLLGATLRLAGQT